MLTRPWRAIGGCIVAILLALAPAGLAQAESSGVPHVFVMAGSSLDRYTSNPTPTEQAWFSTNVWRMGVYAPYFNERTAWYHNGWVYKDSYAVYPGSSEITEHPEWILKGAGGERLYIPWGCSGGTCPQYAANIANAGYRQAWIANLGESLAHGYRGAFIDDVNMALNVSNGNGEDVAPIDPATGKAMTAEAWRAYMAQFMEQIRAAFPNIEIAHNAIWYADEDAGTNNANIRAELNSANYIYLERGVNDAGLTGGTGPWSVNALFTFIDQVHSLGKAVVLGGVAEEEHGLTYNLASYFLVSTGEDGVAGGGQTPSTWWPGWDTNLGEALGARYTWQGLLRRDFTDGMALVNLPGEPTRTITLPYPMRNAEGRTVTEVKLEAASGAILTGSAPVKETEKAPETEKTPTETTVEPTPAPTPTPTPTPTEGSKPPSGEPPKTTEKGPPPPSKAKGGPVKPPEHKRPPFLLQHSGNLAAAATTRRKARTVPTRIIGKVRHATAGKIAIRIETLRGGRWVVAAHMSTWLNSHGDFLRVVRLRTGVRYRVRAFYRGTSTFLPSKSRLAVFAPHASSATRRAEVVGTSG